MHKNNWKTFHQFDLNLGREINAFITLFFYFFFDRKMEYLYGDLFISSFPWWTKQLPFEVTEL